MGKESDSRRRHSLFRRVAPFVVAASALGGVAVAGGPAEAVRDLRGVLEGESTLDVSFSDLLQHPEKYLGKDIAVVGYSAFFTHNVVSPNNSDSVSIMGFGLFGKKTTMEDRAPEDQGILLIDDTTNKEFNRDPQPIIERRELLDQNWVRVRGKVKIEPGTKVHYLDVKSAAKTTAPKI